MAKSETSEIIKIKNARGSFLRLFKPKAFQEGQTPRFEGTFLLDPTSPEHAETIKAIKEEAKKLIAAQWGEKPKKLGESFYKLGHVLTGTGGGTMTLDYEDVGGPPLHPQCRCTLIPVLESDGVA